jgi:chaperonin GroEL
LLQVQTLWILKGIDQAVEAIVKDLEKQAKVERLSEMIKQVASISANNFDDVIGDLIAKALVK